MPLPRCALCWASRRPRPSPPISNGPKHHQAETLRAVLSFWFPDACAAPTVGTSAAPNGAVRPAASLSSAVLSGNVVPLAPGCVAEGPGTTLAVTDGSPTVGVTGVQVGLLCCDGLGVGVCVSRGSPGLAVAVTVAVRVPAAGVAVKFATVGEGEVLTVAVTLRVAVAVFPETVATGVWLGTPVGGLAVDVAVAVAVATSGVRVFTVERSSSCPRTAQGSAALPAR